jgi:hypothetical protein
VYKPCIPREEINAKASGMPPRFAATAEYPTITFRKPRMRSSETIAIATNDPNNIPKSAVTAESCTLKSMDFRYWPEIASSIAAFSEPSTGWNADRKTLKVGQRRKNPTNNVNGTMPSHAL